LARHRRAREAAILAAVAIEAATIDAIVAEVYKGLDPSLRMAASLNVLAHLEALVETGEVTSDGPLRLDAVFRRV
jgi:hypothetical protein